MDTPETHQKNHSIYLGLGTNTGDRMKNLEAVIQSLPPQVEVVRRSPVYQTPAWGYTEQPDFLNMALAATTQLSPEELLKYLKALETEVGRTATFRWGPREIDVDILLYDDLVFETPELTIPHPQMQGRAFVLVPLADIAPDLIHPTLQKTIAGLRNEVDQTGITPFITDTPAER